LRFVDDDVRGLSAIRDIEDDWVPFGRPVPFVVVLVRGVFAPDAGSSVSAFRFRGCAGLAGREAGVEGFSPVMEASRSPIYGWWGHMSAGSPENEHSGATTYRHRDVVVRASVPQVGC
jgi:hypothetical protein